MTASFVKAGIHNVAQARKDIRLLAVAHLLGIEDGETVRRIGNDHGAGRALPAKLSVRTERAGSCTVNVRAHTEAVAVARKLCPGHRAALMLI